MIAIELSKQINFTVNLEEQSTIFEEAKETVLDFSQRIVKVL